MLCHFDVVEVVGTKVVKVVCMWQTLVELSVGVICQSAVSFFPIGSRFNYVASKLRFV